MEEHNGENPQNARIRIKYSGKNKPIVSFRYPLHKKDAFIGNMFFQIFMIWVFINLPLTLYYVHVQETKEIKEIYNDSTNYAYSQYYNLSNYSDFLEYYNQPGRINATYEMLTTKWAKQVFKNYDFKGLLFLLYLFGGFCLLWFPFRKYWNKLYPDYQAWFASKKYKKFIPADLQQTKDGRYYVELPVFSNIICDFKAEGDFSKQMEEFEIEEYKFQSWKKQITHAGKNHGRLKKKFFSKHRKRRKQNEWIWYARWYFACKPEKGFLEVKYA